MTPEQFHALWVRVARLEQPEHRTEPLTDEEQARYLELKTKWQAQDPAYCAQRAADLEAALDQTYDRLYPDWKTPPPSAPRTTKELMREFVATAPELYSEVGTRNGNGRP